MADPNAFSTVVVPAAGLGTRFLPVTKSVPKELLPVLNIPAIELVAAEAAQAGAERLVIVTAPGKESLARHFQPNPQLEDLLHACGKDALAQLVRRAPGLLSVETVVQETPLGLGHAVACAEPVLTGADDAVAVILPDDILLPADTLTRMAAVRQDHGGTVMCAFTASRDRLGAYGVFDLEDATDTDAPRVRGMVEKPDPALAPSTFACAGRYLLDRSVFELLKRVRPGARGEIDLTDAVVDAIAEGQPVHAIVHSGTRHDIGDPQGMLRAAVDFALSDPAADPTLRDWLGRRLALPV
ncbi:UDP-glucose pyrophosphorylase [Lentzea atacamensis]|uniref:UTP--glucose-1-phosphate uridylyltransferase n=1 Tax=Lentzea atacamensis TaxID=531938 RepID=A0A316HL38_9PSEU|nr:UTP--glucose-1-phosphate uridylyltransferase [Lentzea atacamensis]PWK80691.1 UDP-glucose pyrophosphorylase [Lentzea atacamensis]